MGYGAGREMTVYFDFADVKYVNGELSFPDCKISHWDLKHPMDGMTEIKGDLLKVKLHPLKLSKEDKKFLKDEGVKNGDYLFLSITEPLKGCLWSGWVRTPVEKSFPVEIKGEFRIEPLGYVSVAASIYPKKMKDFKQFVADVLDFYPQEIDGYTFEEQYDDNYQYCREEYGFKRK